MRTLGAICGLVLVDCASGHSLQVEPLLEPLQGAGCSYSLGENLPPIFAVSSRSIPNHRIGVARIRVNGTEYALDLIGPQAAKAPIYSRGDVSVEIFDHIDIDSACASSECEGSFQHARIKIVTPSGSAILAVHAHCGA